MPKKTLLVEQIFKTFAKNNPEPKTELIYNSNFELLIAVILSAQATDKSVNKATEKLFSVANTPEAILNLGIDDLKKYIQSINFFQNKALYIIRTCKILVQNYHSQVPNTRENLENLPGVGRKTANVLLNTLFGQHTLAVDTHIYRVAHRLKFSTGKTPKKVELDLLKLIPKKYLKNAHHWLVLHGRYICQARKPKCALCPIQKYCPSQQI